MERGGGKVSIATCLARCLTLKCFGQQRKQVYQCWECSGPQPRFQPTGEACSQPDHRVAKVLSVSQKESGRNWETLHI